MSVLNSTLKDTGSVEQKNRLICMYAKTIFHLELTLSHSGFLLFQNKICPEVFKISRSVLQSKKIFIWQWAEIECWWKKDLWYFDSLSLRGLNHPLLFYHIIFLMHCQIGKFTRKNTPHNTMSLSAWPFILLLPIC